MKIAIVMDFLHHIHVAKDSTLAIMAALQARGAELYYLTPQDLSLQHNIGYGFCRPIRLLDNPTNWYALEEGENLPLTTFNAILMRKDPPFNMDYIYSTYILEQAAREGVYVSNHPQSLRDCNEKLFALQFPTLCPPSLVSSHPAAIKHFVHTHQHCVLKPLDAMGGARIFQIKVGDPNVNVLIDTATSQGTTLCMVQRFIPEIAQGDKRVLIVFGEPIPHMLVRIPTKEDFRGNLAAGATFEVRPLTTVEQTIAESLKESFIERGLDFVGIDIIGEYLTEINVTSPTGIKEIQARSGCQVATIFAEALFARKELSR